MNYKTTSHVDMCLSLMHSVALSFLNYNLLALIRFAGCKPPLARFHKSFFQFITRNNYSFSSATCLFYNIQCVNTSSLSLIIQLESPLSSCTCLSPPPSVLIMQHVKMHAITQSLKQTKQYNSVIKAITWFAVT